MHWTPDDITRVYFRDPETRSWHPLIWEHATPTTPAFSEDGLRYARRLAAAKYRFPDDRLAMTDLLESCNIGLGHTAAERRIALRLARQAFVVEQNQAQNEIPAPPSVAETLDDTPNEASDDPLTSEQPLTGDDDEDFDDADDFYAEALEHA